MGLPEGAVGGRACFRHVPGTAQTGTRTFTVRAPVARYASGD